MSGNLSIYIHIPFCLKKCLYCDFISKSLKGVDEEESGILIANYCECLKSELFSYGRLYGERVVDTVFFGGGTPSILGNTDFDDVMKAIKNNFKLACDAEITMEMNPETVSYARLVGYKESGLNRISMGAQSFNDEILANIGRIHTSKTIISAFEMARKAGFDNINLDLMIGLSNQNIQDIERDISFIENMDPDHISAYMLKLEEGTPYEKMERRGQLNLPTDSEELKMFNYAMDKLESMGYRRYEVSNFAKKGFESRHNKTYWEYGDYLGIGAAAHGFVDNIRYENTKVIDDYIDLVILGESPVFSKESIGQEEMIFEAMMLGLRLIDGISMRDYEKRFGFDFNEKYMSKAQKLVDSGLAEFSGENNEMFRFTKKGFELHNYALGELL